MVLSSLRRVVLAQLAKAFKLSLSIPASRLVTLFKLNGLLTYRFLRGLESDGVVEQVSKGRWMLKDSFKARSLAEYALSEWRSTYPYFPENVPDVYYYMADLPTPWFGGVAYHVIIAEPILKGRITPPSNKYKVIYVPLRGRRARFNWSIMMPVGEREQSIADLLSYDPYWPVELYITWYYGDFDLDGVARRCTPHGLRRLASFISFMRMSVGRPRIASFDYLALLDEEAYKRYVSEYFTWIFANGVDVKRNV